MKILVLGSQGMLGKELVSRLPAFARASSSPITVIAANHTQVDITQCPDTSRFVERERPDVIVNCAAFTNVDACETHISEAFAVNATGAKNIALAGKEIGARLIHISTDFVFDGIKNESYVETDQPNPVSMYGKSKHKGELAIQETSETYTIIRTAWLYGHGKKNFVTTIRDIGNKKGSVSVVTDQCGSPTYTADLSYAIWIIISKNLQGIYHVANTGTCSRYEWARKIFELTGDQVSVYPLKTEDYKRAATVPPNSSLNCLKYTTASGHTMRPWQEALKEYLGAYINQ